MAIKLYIEDESGEGDVEVDIPTCFEVCPRCEGRGTHTNPAIDGHGISAEEMHEDPDFAEDYMRGVYDVQCYECDGLRVVEMPDEDRMTDAMRAAWEGKLECEAEERRHRKACDEGWGW